MADISAISGITGSILELFRAAGIETAESLLGHSAAEILAVLDKENSQYDIPVRRPSETTIRAWQDSARNLLQKQQRPTAKMVPEESLRAAGIDLNAAPLAKVVVDPLPRPREEPKPFGSPLNPGQPAEAKRANPEAAPTPKPERRSAPETRPRKNPELAPMPAPDWDTVASKGPADKRAVAGRKANGPKPAKSLSPKKKKDPASPAGGPVTQSGPQAPPEWVDDQELDPTSKRFRHIEAVKRAKPQGERRNRGMSHPDAPRVWLAAAITVLALIACFVAGAVLIGSLVMARVYGWEFHWTISLILLVFPVSLVLYLSIGVKAKCRLCGQRLFVPKHCLKHERARRSIFGYTFAVARDAMLFASYRCMLCGTKTRLKG